MNDEVRLTQTRVFSFMDALLVLADLKTVIPHPFSPQNRRPPPH
jgi:hypothetical protein